MIAWTNKAVALGENQSFDVMSIGGIPLVYNFFSPLVTKMFNRYGVNCSINKK